MIRLENIINERLINLELKANSKQSAIKELAGILFREGKLKSRIGFIDSVYERENSMSTYCGSDIAIPHARSLFVQEASFAFGRTKGFSWGEDDGNVNFIFLLAIPEVVADNSSESFHIGLISSIAELGLEKDIRNKWATAKTCDDILATFRHALTYKIVQ